MDFRYDGWNIVREIGSGTYGSVYEIERTDFGYTYKSALKRILIPKSSGEIDALRDEFSDDISVANYYESITKSFVRELELMSKLRGNTNIVSYEDHSVKKLEDGISWEILIRMELLSSLPKYMKTHPLTVKDIVKIGADICRALEICEKNNIIHRDIKPDNIFVSEGGDYKLGDFGIARVNESATSAMTRSGTPNYMAPEVYMNQPYNATVDIYSLGIVLYKLLNNNRIPFLPPYPNRITAEDQDRAIKSRMTGMPMPAPAKASDELAKIVLKACDYNRESRYQDAASMRSDLLRLYYSMDNESTMVIETGAAARKAAKTGASNEFSSSSAAKSRESTSSTSVPPVPDSVVRHGDEDMTMPLTSAVPDDDRTMPLNSQNPAAVFDDEKTAYLEKPVEGSDTNEISEKTVFIGTSAAASESLNNSSSGKNNKSGKVPPEPRTDIGVKTSTEKKKSKAKPVVIILILAVIAAAAAVFFLTRGKTAKEETKPAATAEPSEAFNFEIVWNDDDDSSEKRPESVAVNLLENDKVIKTVTLSEKTDWKDKLDDLESYSKDNTYEVELADSEALKDDYEYKISSSSGENSRTYTVTFDLIEKAVINFSVTWDDDDDKEGDRPNALVLNFYEDGEVVSTVTLTADEDWKASVKDLDPDKEYTSKILERPAHYHAEKVFDEKTSTFVYTMTYVPEATPTPTPTPTPKPTSEPTAAPTATPAPAQDDTPSVTAAPTAVPTAVPTQAPSYDDWTADDYVDDGGWETDDADFG